MTKILIFNFLIFFEADIPKNKLCRKRKSIEPSISLGKENEKGRDVISYKAKINRCG